jgi:ribonuclease P protein component
MPSPARRITAWNERDIRRSLRKSRRVVRSSYADISVLPADGEELGRILIIIPKKVGTAVVRNRIRRRIRALFFEKKLFSQGLSWIMYVKHPLGQSSFSELSALFEQWREQIGKSGLTQRSS